MNLLKVLTGSETANGLDSFGQGDTFEIFDTIKRYAHAGYTAAINLRGDNHVA